MSTDNGRIKFNFHAWEFAQRRSVKPSVRRRPLRLHAGAAIKEVDTHFQVSNGDILIAEGRRLILANSILISLERRPRSRESAERKIGELLQESVQQLSARKKIGDRDRDQPARGFRPHSERWEVSDWEQVLRRCTGEESHLLFECENVNVSKEEEASFVALFKHSKSSKNEYKTSDYKDRLRRNVAVALIQLLQPQRTTYITSWQVGFVELACPELRFIALAFCGTRRDNTHSRRREYRSITSLPS
ncbi:hypothetical protein AXG93_1913s1630 [Marchantia polymorpha subsp. ruderalis]|uniref:Uncharacterized protein n=1 Tax=Marchantia polymorpha subsp. ruderalis TaxID=1480154 RepID=A0A176WKD1_MARPO|nr:hypothetical protein AXG93_1913s1630 [Marchantia polymorpha subsp. ruderalis]